MRRQNCEENSEMRYNNTIQYNTIKAFLLRHRLVDRWRNTRIWWWRRRQRCVGRCAGLLMHSAWRLPMSETGWRSWLKRNWTPIICMEGNVLRSYWTCRHSMGIILSQSNCQRRMRKWTAWRASDGQTEVRWGKTLERLERVQRAATKRVQRLRHLPALRR